MSSLSFTPFGMRFGRWCKRIFITIEVLFWSVFFLFAVSILALRFIILPSIESYKPRIEATLTRALAAQVSIGSIQAGWQGLRPELDLGNVKILDAGGRPALVLPAVSIAMSWWSVPRGELRLHQLDISGADLDIRRLADGRLFIGGIEIKSSGDDSGSDWILTQRRIGIRDSRLRWNDEKRAAPELALSNISLALENVGDRHRFGFSADPPSALASRVDVRADLHGSSLNNLRGWRGEVYANLNYIDLAAWRAWLDYPADVQAGAGGVRAWAGFSGDRLEHFTADLSLANAAARLRSDLPVLELTRVSGRVSARELASGGMGFGFLRWGQKKVTGFEVTGKQVALTTTGGVAFSPADFSIKTTAPRGHEPQIVEMQANALDLEPMARLAEHLPLDASFRHALTEYNPRGSIYDFRFNWRGDFDKPQSYAARGRFFALSLDAHDDTPGFLKLSGSVDANEKGGTLYLASKNSALLMPHVFEDPQIDLDSLTAQVKWTFPNNRLEMVFDDASFSNADAAGTASGTYRAEPGTPGYVDLQARLTRGDGKRVYRYMPNSIAHTREWLKDAINDGAIDEARLILRGNLRDYPYIDPKLGLFRVNVKVRDMGLAFSEGWPKLEKIRGELVFEKNSMELHAQSATSRATRLNKVDVRIPDLGSHPHMLEVQGSSEGTTSAFLDYIAQSPVDRYIDGFTQTMRGTGTGKLAIKMALPIEDSEKLRITGSYQFINADLLLDEGLPQLGKVNGSLDFTEKGIALKNLHGDSLGGPFTLNGTSRGDVISLNAQGNFTLPGLRTWLNDPLLARATGGSAWKASINIRKKAPEIVVESNLVGTAFDLPAPFTKAAADTMPLRVVKTGLPARGEDELNVTLEKLVSARLQRRPEGNAMVIARGAIGVGDALPALPRTGLAINVTAPRIDVEEWKTKLIDAPPAPVASAPVKAPSGPGPIGAAAAPAATAAAPSTAGPGAAGNLFVSSLNLRTETLNAYGRTLNQVRLTGGQENGAWALNIASKEATGDVTFRAGAGGAQGKVTARLKNLVIPPSENAQVSNSLDRSSGELPALDIVADSFEANNKKLGKLTFVAENMNGEWALQKVSLENPDGDINASGAWRVRQSGESKRRIDLKFTLDTHDAGKLLERLGFAGTLRSGNGQLKGSVGWNGSPFSIDYPSLRGDLSLSIKAGQFLKADPGVAKLLGIMSLQALPRRLTLDFRDIFSQGFAFDEVSASSKIEQGVLSTTDFKMTSVTAVVVMNGEVDLARETQNLKVNVLPDLSGGMGSVAAAIAVVNPIIGVPAYLAQRLLRDPLSKAFSFEYAVNGTWADPKVVRVQVPRSAATGSGNAEGATGNKAEEKGGTGQAQGATPAESSASPGSGAVDNTRQGASGG